MEDLTLEVNSNSISKPFVINMVLSVNRLVSKTHKRMLVQVHQVLMLMICTAGIYMAAES